MRGAAATRILVALAVATAAALGGFAAGRIDVRDRAAHRSGPSSEDPPVKEPAAPPVPPLPIVRELALELAEAKLPAIDELGSESWLALARRLEQSCERRGLGSDPATWRRAAEPGEPGTIVELAALADARAWIEHAAGREEESKALIAVARALDPEATRDSLRAPMLASDDAAVRTIAASLDVPRLSLRTATLLGAALLRAGDVDGAIDTWRTASIEHPDDATLHLLLGWRVLGLDPPWIDEARRQLEAARALLPASAAAKARLDAVKS
jgi:hypothetical protein